MLYGYPIEAVKHNWLHDTLLRTLRSVHERLDDGRGVSDWPDVLPSGYRECLKGRTGLRDRIQVYIEAVGTLNKADRDRVLRGVAEQNDIQRLVSCTRDCEGMDELPEAVRAPTRDLFRFAFRLLSDLGIRDTHYAVIYDRSKQHVCAFCGCEYFDAPSAPREALDHYLLLDIYPFAGANLRNLVPMGTKCNSQYKGNQDILRRENGVRRRSFDPYGEVPEISVCLDESVPFAGRDGELPQWRIRFDVEAEEVDTWLTVFSIRKRYARDVLDAHFSTWLGEFSAWCRESGITHGQNGTVLDAMSAYGRYLAAAGLGDRAFLKCAVFRMLERCCREGNQRLLAFVKSLVLAETRRTESAG